MDKLPDFLSEKFWVKYAEENDVSILCSYMYLSSFVFSHLFGKSTRNLSVEEFDNILKDADIPKLHYEAAKAAQARILSVVRNNFKDFKCQD